MLATSKDMASLPCCSSPLALQVQQPNARRGAADVFRMAACASCLHASEASRSQLFWDLSKVPVIGACGVPMEALAVTGSDGWGCRPLQTKKAS